MPRLPQIYTLIPARAPWGDYGHILMHGIGKWATNKLKTVGVERTGPYIPPMTLPSGMSVIVTEDLRDRLMRSALTGLRFLLAPKFRIVKLAWEKWDRTLKLPPRRPFGGEPEGYVLQGRHNPDTSKAMGRLFELRPRQRVRFIDCGAEKKWGSTWSILRVDPTHWRGDDFFLGERGYSVYVTERARRWLSRYGGPAIAFEEQIWAPILTKWQREYMAQAPAAAGQPFRDIARAYEAAGKPNLLTDLGAAQQFYEQILKLAGVSGRGSLGTRRVEDSPRRGEPDSQ